MIDVIPTPGGETQAHRDLQRLVLVVLSERGS